MVIAMYDRIVFRVFMLLAIASIRQPSQAAELVGTVIDADSGLPIPARIYIEDAAGKWWFVQSASPTGSAVPYREQWVPIPHSVEQHTTVSADPFHADLSPGDYRVTIERGKEYLPLTETITMGDQPHQHTFRLQRWVNMAQRGWFSGETHVHRRIAELPNVMLAEDLNVAFPVTFWTTRAQTKPALEPSSLRSQGPSPWGPRIDRGYAPIAVDSTHVMFPRNTEYEIFTVQGQQHVLGAIFVLNHRTVFHQGVPPIAKIAKQAHLEGALLDLDKHNWPWSMMLVPVAKIDLYELANNSVWRTKFGMRHTSVAPAPFMRVETTEGRMTEWGWLNYGFETYYMLLNCGFRLQPTAGTASGVHPVPLGHSRAYVHVGKPFDAQAWLKGLRQGRSFVTTGPMLLATLDQQDPGERFVQRESTEHKYHLQLESISARPLDRIEVVVNGRVVRTVRPNSSPVHAPYDFAWEGDITIDESSWLAVRSFQMNPQGRVRFAHTAPWHFEVANQPIRPRREQVEYLVKRMREEIARNQTVLSHQALEEFHQALSTYEALLDRVAPSENRAPAETK
jgi:hypothetical protein